jgi:hypothetical protein
VHSVSVQVRQLVTHRDPDIDDVEAIRLLITRGESHFPGISQAEIVTTADRNTRSSEELESEGVILVGIGGSKFDEHPHEGRERRAEDCAATLVAKHLGVADAPELQANLAYALDKNYRAVSSHWDLSVLVKLAFRFLSHSGDEEADRRMTQEILYAAFMFLGVVERGEGDGEVSVAMDEFAASWVVRGLGEDIQLMDVVARTKPGKSFTMRAALECGVTADPALQFILRYASPLRGVELGEADFQLHSLVALAQTHFIEREKIQGAVDIFLSAVYAKDKAFWDCRKDYDVSRNTFTARSMGNHVSVVSVISSNTEIAKFCRSKHGGAYDVVIKREPSGNTQVFFEHKVGIDVAPIVAELRIAERAKKGLFETLSREVLEAQGCAVEGAEEWYYDGHQIMNGSLTTNVTPTKLSREEVERIVVCAINKQ